MIWNLGLFLAVALLAYANGANDNFKGVATLFGSGTADYRRAVGWATLTTFAGSLFSLVLAGGLVHSFSGKGLVPDAIAGSPLFLAAVALGAGGTVLLATWTGFPISTTHALTGALLGSGMASIGSQVDFAKLGKAFFLPLAASPLMAFSLAAAAYLIFRAVRKRVGIEKDSCLCLEPTKQNVAIHFLSAGMVGFARGLNDTPKLVALLLGSTLLGVQTNLAAIALAMAIGGMLGARKVALTMSRRITPMNPGQGNPRVILQIMLSWLLTLPVGALFGYAVFLGGGWL